MSDYYGVFRFCQSSELLNDEECPISALSSAGGPGVPLGA